jgi:phage shock protein PspC (stress-responsive transcriptional regulator)
MELFVDHYTVGLWYIVTYLSGFMHVCICAFLFICICMNESPTYVDFPKGSDETPLSLKIYMYA